MAAKIRCDYVFSNDSTEVQDLTESLCDVLDVVTTLHTDAKGHMNSQ